ncbi:MAG: sulfatase/phosphatase domain-containing protein, partial [Akkermansiaceae bacterium]
RAAGYHLAHVGKWHNGKFPADKFHYGKAYHGRHWLKQKDGTQIHVTKKNEADAINYLRTRPKDQPFCLTVSFFATHAQDNHPDQFLPQPASMKLYRDQKIPVPSNATAASWRRLPEFFNEENEGRNRWHWRFDTPAKYQRMMKNYYRLATEVDATCGVILGELKKQGVLDNTLVIFTTDNGYYHGEHGLADKWYPHQESIRVPLVIVDPRMKRRGSTHSAVTLNIDLAATILTAAGITPPATMQGQDISPLYLSEQSPAWRTDFFYEHPTLRNRNFIPASEALVTKEWKYIYWPEHDVEQLFHLTTDPQEEKDLINHPRHKERIKQMKLRFAELKKKAR